MNTSQNDARGVMKDETGVCTNGHKFKLSDGIKNKDIIICPICIIYSWPDIENDFGCGYVKVQK